MADTRDPAEMPGPIRQAEIDLERAFIAALALPAEEPFWELYDASNRILAGNADERDHEIPF